MVEGLSRVGPTARTEDDPRLEEVLDVIFRFAAGDLKARGTLARDDSAVDGVIAGINILGEELEAYAAETQKAQDSLRRSLDYAETLIGSSPDGILAVDRDLLITEWNRLMERICGTAREQAVGRLLDEIPFMRETGEATRIRQGLNGTPLPPTELAYRTPGSNIQSFFETLVAILRNETGGIDGAVLRVGDITERRRAEEQLRLASVYARSLIEASLDPLVTISAEGRIMDANEAAVEGTGTPRERLIGSDFAAYFTEPDKAHAAYGEAFTKGSVRNFPLTLRHESGKRTDVLYNASVYHAENGEVAGVLAVARDITERKRAEQAEELARRDSLTGLYNHRTFYELLRDEIARARRFKRPVSLLMLDIDLFKHVNDTLGHQAGDFILKGLSNLLAQQARDIDHVCRYGGEEFAVILPETDTVTAMQIAERLRSEIAGRAFGIGDGQTSGVTVSVGVATYPQQAASLEALIRHADIALYAAKQAGRNRVTGPP
jgi:diguanylate cyclase (GGDEF)-like protein/PAS domain S-box-containing protein